MPDPLDDFLAATFPAKSYTHTDRWLFVHREHMDEPDAKLAALHEALLSNPDWVGGRRPRIFDFTLKGTSLGELNILAPGFGTSEDDASAAAADRHYRNVAGVLAEGETALDADERERLVLAPFVDRVECAPTVHVDHHYDVPALTFVTTTTLVLDFFRYLHRIDRVDLVQALQNTFGMVDHSDADIVFSNATLARGHDHDWLRKHATLLRDATLRNDYAVVPKKHARRTRAENLYHFAIDLEARIKDGAITLDAAFAELDRALRVLLRGRAEAPEDVRWFKRCVHAGGRLTREAKVLLARLSPDYRRFDRVPTTVAEADLRPGSLRRLGPVLAVIGDPDGGLVESAEIVAAAQAGALADVEAADDPARVVVTASRVETGHLVKIRTLAGPRGAFNLVPVFKRLGADPVYGPLSPGGRRIAGGLCKRPVADLDVLQAVLDVSKAIETEATRT